MNAFSYYAWNTAYWSFVFGMMAVPTILIHKHLKGVKIPLLCTLIGAVAVYVDVYLLYRGSIFILELTDAYIFGALEIFTVWTVVLTATRAIKKCCFNQVVAA